MSETLIHPTAIISPKAKLGEGVKIGPFSVIYDDVEIGDRTEIRSHAIIADGARIGQECLIHVGAIISTEPQDLKYDGEKTYAIIGNKTEIREYSTINRATASTTKTEVGENCLIMSYCHVAHDCKLGNNVIMANLAQIAGHVVLQDYVILGAYAKVHQFCRIGAHTMVGADCGINKDVPPFVLLGRPSKIEGLNKIGLRRRGFTNEVLQELEEFYDLLIFSGLNTRDGIAKFKERKSFTKEAEYCISFIDESQRGIHR
jgi:UDP-N-acetylglucosamine acyltransferase